MPSSGRAVQSSSFSKVTRSGPPHLGSNATVHAPVSSRTVASFAKLPVLGPRSCAGGARKSACKRRCEGQGGIPALHPVARRAATRRPKAAAKTAMWYSDAYVTATRPPCADRPPPPGGGAENAALRAAANTTFMRKAFRFSGQFATVSQQKPPVFQAFSNFSFFSAFATNSQRIRNSRFRVRCFRCCSFRRMFLDNFRIIPPSKSGRIVDIYLTLA